VCAALCVHMCVSLCWLLCGSVLSAAACDCCHRTVHDSACLAALCSGCACACLRCLCWPQPPALKLPSYVVLKNHTGQSSLADCTSHPRRCRAPLVQETFMHEFCSCLPCSTDRYGHCVRERQLKHATAQPTSKRHSTASPPRQPACFCNVSGADGHTAPVVDTLHAAAFAPLLQANCNRSSCCGGQGHTAGANPDTPHQRHTIRDTQQHCLSTH
jgi:hypothetical protein